jgi:transposase InsO family protein
VAVTPTYTGAEYAITFIDDYTRATWVTLMRSKGEALQCFRDFKIEVENQAGLTIKRLRTDNGSEYVNESFQAHLRLCGIKHERTTPYTPQQNGLAERANRTLMDMVRSMLAHAQLPNFLGRCAQVRGMKQGPDTNSRTLGRDTS